MALSKEEIMEWLKPVEDPELFVSIVELGLVYDVELNDEGNLTVKMTLTSPGCPMGDQIVTMMTQRAEEHESIKKAEVNIVWEPSWDPQTMASEEAKDTLGIW